MSHFCRDFKLVLTHTLSRWVRSQIVECRRHGTVPRWAVGCAHDTPRNLDVSGTQAKLSKPARGTLTYEISPLSLCNVESGSISGLDNVRGNGDDKLFEQHFRTPVERVQPLQGQLGGSGRKITRLANGTVSAIGIVYDVREENAAFIEFSRHFRKHGLPVPEIYAEDLSFGAYLEEDLGDTTLFDFLSWSIGCHRCIT